MPNLHIRKPKKERFQSISKSALQQLRKNSSSKCIELIKNIQFLDIVEEFDIKEKLMSITADGAPNMTGHTKGLAGRLKQKLPNLEGYRCVIHEEALCWQCLGLGNTFKAIVEILNGMQGGYNI